MTTVSSLHFQNQMETEAFAKTLALWARPGLVIALEGDLGAGKSTMARALIRALAGEATEFDIPSPTFPIIQTYDVTRIPVAHVDLYRLSSAEEIEGIGLSEVISTHFTMIEWPGLAENCLPLSTLHINLQGSGESRQVQLALGGAWIQIFTRNKSIEYFIANSNWKGASRAFFEGDASSRRYEKLSKNGEHVLLMDMPQRPDGPPVKFGKPYSQIAHLAEGIQAVVSINTHLNQDFGYSAPVVFQADIPSGLAMMEELGNNVYGKLMLQGKDMTDPMLEAAALLADLAQRAPLSRLENWGATFIVPPYDEQAQLIEVGLLPQWFWQHLHGTEAPVDLEGSFEEIWKTLLPLARQATPQIVLRDFHSPNLLWLPERQGIKRVGLIDTQDAVMGHAAYDLVSMIQDARVDIPDDLASRTFAHYIALRRDKGFSETDFCTAYAILGAQRATKILGIFARLNKRDGKPAYLKHMPRVSRYLAQNLQHPELAPLKHWFEAHVPEALTIGRA
ncbi:MAG: tRNA (adenosine(37)-N6)-threonylcarbamoyltransferase complex ATPase subunit type 1 TsaE [Alphaproteobacteria bacterium]|nr:tRNA (adenosine(37)-N6)-threonylcarbamoyltransferase complex ATPase subunit type 1 TsaE [Alphaproteobacteria bacterium]